MRSLTISLCAFLAAHVGQIFGLSTLRNSFFDLSGVFFLGYSSLHKGFKCLEPSSGRVYISRDVVFDEIVFPFNELHPNAGARLRQEILLLPNDLLNPGDALPNTNVTNDPSSSQTVLQATEKNSAQTGDDFMRNTCEGGVYLAPAPGVRSKEDTAADHVLAAGTRSHADSAPASAAAPREPSEASGSAAPPLGSSTASPRVPHEDTGSASAPLRSATSPPSPPRGALTLRRIRRMQQEEDQDPLHQADPLRRRHLLLLLFLFLRYQKFHGLELGCKVV
jgi:hypothetical protein